MSDDEKRRLPLAQPDSIPVTWSTTKGGGQERVSMPGEALVVAPDERDVALYADPRRVTCASCKKFAHKAGQLSMHEQKFIAKLVAEYQWKVHHLGAGPETFGLCGETNGSRLTSMYSPACEHYRDRNGKIGD